MTEILQPSTSMNWVGLLFLSAFDQLFFRFKNNNDPSDDNY